MRKKYRQPEVGDKFGKWTVLSVGPRCLCRCDCGREYDVKRVAIASGASTQCRSCRSRDNGLVNKVFTYPEGATKRVIWQVRATIQRCTNPKSPKWSGYGGCGIGVFKKWLADQSKFVAYLMTLEGWDDTSLILDRKDNDGHYEPGNLRFVSHSVSQFNKREYKTRKDVGVKKSEGFCKKMRDAWKRRRLA